MGAESKPLLSVIVPALDAKDTIERCVRSLVNQSWPTIEIIVVDNGSRDGTAELASREGARVVLEPTRGRSRARNRGVREARGELLAFLDADCVAPVNWLERSADLLRKPWLAAVQALVQKSPTAPPARRFVQAHYYWPFLDTCALVVSRAAFGMAGGFDEDLARVEDMDFSFRMLASGFALGWLPDTIVYKKHELTPSQALRRGWVGGTSMAVLSRKWQERMGVSQSRVRKDLSKNFVKAILRDARAPKTVRWTQSLEALGRLLGCVGSDLIRPHFTRSQSALGTTLAERLGERRFLVIADTETLLYDAVNQRLHNLNRERSQELEQFIDGNGDPELAARLIRDFGLRPSAP